MVVDRQVNQPARNAFVLFFRERGVQLRFAALVLSAAEAVFLKRAILALVALDSLCPVVDARSAHWPASRSCSMARGVEEQTGILRRAWRTFLALAFTTGLMQLATVLTFRRYAGRLLARALSALNHRQRPARTSLLPGAEHPEAPRWIDGDDRRCDDDRRVSILNRHGAFCPLKCVQVWRDGTRTCAVSNHTAALALEITGNSTDSSSALLL